MLIACKYEEIWAPLVGFFCNSHYWWCWISVLVLFLWLIVEPFAHQKLLSGVVARVLLCIKSSQLL
jgi:hypothetical protein